MKKLALLLCLCLLLTGCAAEERGTAPGTPLAVFSPAQSLAMASTLSPNSFCLSGTTLYGPSVSVKGEPILVSRQLDAGGVGEETLLCLPCDPSCLCFYEDSLFYINAAAGSQIERLYIDSGRRALLIDGPCSALQLRGETLYYCDAGGRFCRAGLDGRGSELLIDDCCGYAYEMDGLVLYQSGRDGKRLHLFDLNTGADRALTAAAAWAPLRLGDALFYSTEKDGGFGLGRLDLLSGEETGLPSPLLRGPAEYYRQGEIWFARAEATEGLIYAPLAATDGAWEPCGEADLAWLGDGLRVERREGGFFLVDANGASLRFGEGE